MSSKINNLPPNKFRPKNRPPQGVYFLPAAVLDYVIEAQLTHARKNDFKPPYRMRVMDKCHRCVCEAQVKIDGDGEVLLKEMALQNEPVEYPIISVLTDMEGRTHSEPTESQEMEKWMRENYKNFIFVKGGALQFVFGEDRPNFSPAVFFAFMGLTIAARMQGLNPPFTGEVWDTEGKLFDRRPINVDPFGQIQVETELVCGADLKFPVTIKLIDRNGVELSQLVERSQ
jgi:hypothetical protein